ncbi:MAG: GAF domain-containing SpoIIE family protein phosphatase [Planctomycetaceae bacterium]|nr:SpoIIE family protein phosphatase [Planctomycetaceae bacterium]
MTDTPPKKPVISEYLSLETVRAVQRSYGEACGGQVCICSPEGDLLESPGQRPPQTSQHVRFEGSVMVDSEQAARVVLLYPKPASRLSAAARNWLTRFTEIIAQTVTQLALAQKRLRSRVEELSAIYRLTAEFTSKRDLKSVLALVTKTVVDLMGIKACAVRLLSDDRTELQIAAAEGLGPEYLAKGPVPLAQSKLDQEVVTTRQPLYVPDVQTDPRILYPAEMAREGIVSLLCVPLIYQGRPEGVIRVYTHKQDVFDWYEISLLTSIAASAAGAIVNARLYQEALRLAEVDRQIKLAAVVQRRMMPETPPTLEGYDIHAAYVPCFELGGDFYDFFPLPQNNLALAVADVVGKGIRASLLMATMRAYLHAHASNIYDMSEVLANVNRDVCEDTLISDFASLFYGVIDTQSGQFTYANAGHPPALLVRDGTCCHLKSGGTVLGVDLQANWGHEMFVLESGDTIVAYTDGLTEALNFADEAFGLRRVEEAVSEAVAAGYNAQGITRHIFWRLHRFSGLQTAIDDVTVMVVRKE